MNRSSSQSLSLELNWKSLKVFGKKHNIFFSYSNFELTMGGERDTVLLWERYQEVGSTHLVLVCFLLIKEAI